MLKATAILGVYSTSGGTTQIASGAITLTCNTATGPGAAYTVYVKPLTAIATSTAAIGVTLSAIAGTGPTNIVVAPAAGTTLSQATGFLAYTISLAPVPSTGCGGAGLGATAATFNFKSNVGTIAAAVFTPGGTTNVDVAMSAGVTVTSTTSGLTLAAGVGTTLYASSTLNFTCTYNGTTYYPSAPQTVLIGSTAGALGTPFTLDGTGSLPAAWLSTPTFAGGGTATAGAPVTMTVQLPANTCDGLAVPPGTNTAQTFINLESTGFPAIDKEITVNITVTAPGASPLVVNPSPITVSCVGSGTAFNAAQTVSVTAAASTAFTIGSAPAIPAWLNMVGGAGTAGTTAATFTLQAHSTCNAGTATTTTIHLVVAGYQDKIIQVTLQIVPATILTATPTSASFTYVKGSGTAGFADVAISSSIISPYFSINDTTLPSWLRTDTNSGNAPRSVRFSSTTIADTMAPGTYTAGVIFSVSGYGDKTVNVSMQLTNKAPTLTVEGANPVQLNWIIGSALPNPTITALSTDTPIAYTATTGGSLAPVIAAGEQSGLAYSFGSPITVSFSPAVFAGAQPGNVLTGTVTLTYGSPAATIVVTFQVTVVSPGATITYLSPSTLPNGQASYSLSLVGTGFVPTGASQTTVGIVQTPGAAMYFDPAISYNVMNQSNIALTLTVPSGIPISGPNTGLDAGGIPFNTAGHVTIGVCNPVGGAPCSIATASQVLYFGSNPIIQAVTSSSSLLQGSITPPAAAYDMISIFGANFCPDCTSSAVLTNSPDPVLLTYAESLVHGGNTLTVAFQTHSTHALISNAPLLFATNNQINLLVPSGVVVATATDIVVSYGGGTPQLSTAFPVTIVKTDPGIFTVGADGQGGAAALDDNFNLISATNPAAMRNGVGASDSIAIYMTGLGTPDSSALNSAVATDGAGGTGGLQYPADCVSIATYLNGTPSFNTATGAGLGTLDGAVIIPSVLNTGRLVPCIDSGGVDVVTATVGGQTTNPVTVTYAGWVPGTIAGLYQVNILLPDNTAAVFIPEGGSVAQAITQPVQLPITITSHSQTTQTGVSIWVAPRLKMLGPVHGGNANTLSVSVGIPMLDPVATSTYTIANAVSATLGTGAVTYAVTSGLLPAGLSILASGAYAGQIVGTPAANTGNPGSNAYTVTVTATDSATIPVTGTNTFVVTVGDGLFMTYSTPLSVPVFSVGGPVTTVQASGGVAAYSYFLSNGYTTATGISIGQLSGTISVGAATLAGSYTLVITAYDNETTQLAGTLNLPIVVALDEAAIATATSFHVGVTSGAANTMVTTGEGTGGPGTITYTLDPASQALVTSGLLTFDSSTGIVTVTGTSTVTGGTSITVLASSSGIPYFGDPQVGTAGGAGSSTFTITIVP